MTSRKPAARWRGDDGGMRRYPFAALAALLLATFAACDGGGGPEPTYTLKIDGPETLAVDTETVVLTGEGFVPAGSSCPGGCEGPLPPPVFGQLGPYTLRWENAAGALSGAITLAWICNCGGSAPYWISVVPLRPGDNRIVVTQRAGGVEQRDEVLVTRR